MLSEKKKIKKDAEDKKNKQLLLQVKFFLTKFSWSYKLLKGIQPELVKCFSFIFKGNWKKNEGN